MGMVSGITWHILLSERYSMRQDLYYVCCIRLIAYFVPITIMSTIAFAVDAISPKMYLTQVTSMSGWFASK